VLLRAHRAEGCSQNVVANQSVRSGIIRFSLGRVVKASQPFVGVLLLFLILVTCMPPMPTWLPCLLTELAHISDRSTALGTGNPGSARASCAGFDAMSSPETDCGRARWR
jgi:hypothetical protein